MKIGLIDVDRTGFPNLALMKLSAWHKAQGDQTLLLDDREHMLLALASCDKFYASAVFTWNRHRAEAWEALGATIGGSGISLSRRLPPHIEAMPADYGLYGLNYGVGFLSRGCIRDCSFCIVPQKDGRPRQVATISDLLNPARKRPFIVLLDDEFLWNVKWAIAQLQEFTNRGIDWCPSQGLDIRCTTPPLCAALAVSPFWNVHRSRRQITFAFDHVKTEARYRQGVEMLFAAGIKAWQLQSFMLVGYDSTLADDLRRLSVMREYGIDPFVMVFRDADTGQAISDQDRRNLARWANRRLYKVCDFKDYRRFEHERPLAS